VYYKTVVQLSEATIGIVLAMNGILISLIEMVLVYHLQHRYSDFQYMVIGGLLMGGSFLLLAIAPVLTMVVAAMLAITFGEMFLFPYTNNLWINRSTEANRGQYVALYAMTFAVAQVLAPIGAAHVVQRFHFNTLFILDFLMCLLAAIGFYFLHKQVATHGTI